MLDLSIALGDIKIANPFLAASGTFGYGTEYGPLVDLHNLGAIITKSLSLDPRPGNDPPRIWETPSGMLNSIGLENGGLEYFVRYRVPELEALPTQVLVNVVGNSIEEYASVCQRLDKIGAVDGFEINISCPNVRHGCRFSSDPADAERLMRALRASTGKLLMAKLSPNVTDIAMIGRAAVAGGAQALSLINTLLGMAIDPHTRRPRLANLTGGLSGPAIHPVAVRCVYQVAQACPGIPIVGVGGVRTLEDALEFFIAGASAVQIGTAIYSDPGLLNQLPGQLSSWLASHGLNSQKDLIGTLRPF